MEVESWRNMTGIRENASLVSNTDICCSGALACRCPQKRPRIGNGFGVVIGQSLQGEAGHDALPMIRLASRDQLATRPH